MMTGLRPAALAAAVLLAGLVTTSHAQVKLQFKFPEDQKYSYQSTTKVDQVLTINGMEIPTKSDQVQKVRMEFGKKREDGSIPIHETIVSIKTVLDLPGGINLTLDSEDNGEAPKDEPEALKPLRETVKALAGANFTIVVNKDGEVSAIEGAEKGLPKADALDPAIADALKKRFEADRLKRESKDVFGMFPKTTVRPGEPWDRTEVMDIGSGQTLTFLYKYEYVGTTEQDGKTLDKLAVKASTISYQMDNPASPIQLGKSDLKIASSDGTILFDREAGRIASSDVKSRITGDLTLVINGKDLPSTLDLTIGTGTRIIPDDK